MVTFINVLTLSHLLIFNFYLFEKKKSAFDIDMDQHYSLKKGSGKLYIYILQKKSIENHHSQRKN